MKLFQSRIHILPGLLIFLEVLSTPLFNSKTTTSSVIVQAIPVPSDYLDLQLGSVVFDVSTTNEDAAQWFNYGLLQLMCFGYHYAGLAFNQSRTEDPTFALAYAFQALTNYEPLWFDDYTVTANQILDEMNSNPSTTMNHRESLYIDAIAMHFNTSIENVETRKNISIQSLDLVHKEYPDDSTALAYMALWRLDFLQYQSGDAEMNTNAQAIQYLNESFTLDPTNPAPIHFMLHAYDNVNTTIAKQGLPAAKLYPQIAPGTSHGVHMPMHILFRFGNWSQAYDADKLALAASDRTCAVYNLSTDPLCDVENLYHSLAYLQVEAYNTGQWQAAKTYLTRMEQNYTNALELDLDLGDSDFCNLYNYYLQMIAREFLIAQATAGQLFEKNLQLDPSSCPPAIEPLLASSLNSTSESGYLLARGLCQVFATDLTITANQNALNETLRRIEEIPSEYGADDKTNPANYYIYLQNAMHAKELQGAYYYAQGRTDDFHSTFLNATNIDDSLHLYFTQGGYTINFGSANELYGQLLLASTSDGDDDDDNNKEKKLNAMKHFVHAEKNIGPRLSSALGKARSAETKEKACVLYVDVYNMLYPGLFPQNEDVEALGLPFTGELESCGFFNDVDVPTNSPTKKKTMKNKKRRCKVNRNKCKRAIKTNDKVGYNKYCEKFNTVGCSEFFKIPSIPIDQCAGVI